MVQIYSLPDLKFVEGLNLVRPIWGYSDFRLRLTYEYLALQQKSEYTVFGAS